MRGLEITGRRRKHVVPLPLDGIQDLQPAAAEQFDVEREMLVHHLRQRQPHLKPLAGARNFELHHLQECGRRSTLRNVVFAHAVLRKVLQRKVDAPLAVVDGDVLPEIRQLQGSAGVVGELLALGVAIAAQVQHQMSYGIGGILAIAEHVGERRIAGRRLVLTKSGKQIGEFVLRNVQLAHGLPQSDEDRMPRLARNSICCSSASH